MRASGTPSITLIATSLAVAALTAGCSSDDGDASAEPASTPPASSAPAGSDASAEVAGIYVVEAGDAVFAIAQRHCIGGDELAAANDWGDGVGHAIVPGDTIVLPVNACQPAATTRPAVATSRPAAGAAGGGGGTADTRYLELARAGTIYDPYYSDAFGFWNFVEPECNAAMATLVSFARSAHPDPSKVIAAIDVIDPDDTESDLGIDLANWATFSEQYYDLITEVYEPAIHRPDAAAASEDVLTDPGVVEMLDAYTAIPVEPSELRGAIDAHCTYLDPGEPAVSAPG